MSAPGVRALECRGLGLRVAADPGASRSIFEGVEARFEAAQASLIRGPTGAGKTSLLGLLAGLRRPSEGEVRVGEQAVSRWTPAHRDRWRRRVGLLFQEPRLLEDLSALENVLLPLLPRGLSPSALRERARLALAALDAEPLAARVAAQLSGGERQRVGLARAIAVEPDYLLLDEPSAFQDAAGLKRIRDLLVAASTRGACVVVTSHDPRLAELEVFRARWRLQDGRLEAEA